MIYILRTLERLRHGSLYCILYTLAWFYTVTVYTNIYGRCKVPPVRVYSESSISYTPINERALRIAEGHNDLDLRGILDSHDSYPRVQASRVGEQ